MNIVAIPFHDYRKILLYGYRNRDTHFISNFISSRRVRNVILINRPVSGIELLLKNSPNIEGKVVLKHSNHKLIKIKNGFYVIDTVYPYSITLIIKNKRWIWESYGKSSLNHFILESLLTIGIKEYAIYNSTVYSNELINKMESKNIVFDAFDNWLKFPIFSKWKNLITKSYKDFSKSVENWITNSEENKDFYIREFGTQNCVVLKNGVDFSLFSDTYDKEFSPFKKLSRPVVGFGGSITHLIDTNLFNHIVKQNPDLSFVIIGPVLDKSVYNRIHKMDNLYFFGNIHYHFYPKYVINFDIGIIPYHTKNNAHGGDAIKFYEYLAARKPIVTTRGNGVYQANANVYISDGYKSFNSNLRRAINNKWIDSEISEDISWSNKTNKILDILNVGY